MIYNTQSERMMIKKIFRTHIKEYYKVVKYGLLKMRSLNAVYISYVSTLNKIEMNARFFHTLLTSDKTKRNSNKKNHQHKIAKPNC